MCADHPQAVPELIIFSLGVVVSQQYHTTEQLSVHLQDGIIKVPPWISPSSCLSR
jgi:hypothetical protein